MWCNLPKENAENNPKKPTFVDIGANIGQHSLFMSQIVPHVVAFEPFSNVNTKFKHHIDINEIDNIILNEFALSDRLESLQFYAPMGRNQGVGSFDRNTISKGNVAIGQLELTPGDHYFEKNADLCPKLIKIDVEGVERKVVNGLKRTLCNYRPVLVCEISYGKQHSFNSETELIASLPEKYRLLSFKTRLPDGSKAKRIGSIAKRTGKYEIVNFKKWRKSGQDDIIFVPEEYLTLIPRFDDN
tara:strand:- start:529 stop:1257 length:729 start_codon:yes stop_codon:yes gene_type:complete